ncbi:hypothetical protein JET18_20155 [Chryseobacterium sp. L7]|uniref:Uncharacterized protein n=1 Tax=Chryseobacterium endalhagicum TaxID=2797638 RepID=A0ABS1QKL6_9FLAO|nr:hypothetical protein [Chryseobacterium endalhagicum]MBL1223169.1 hypothetical protein [Chryseobacterium endalhagicum]
MTFFLLFFAAAANAQIGVERESVRGSGILDFAEGQDKGIIIPILSTSVNLNPSPGTILMHQSVIKGITGSGPLNLSGTGDTSMVTYNSSAPRASGVNHIIIGNSSSSVSGGALIFEAEDKALILPYVSNVEQMPSPYPGTICYDVNSKSFAVFDGKVWNFWK